MTRLTLQRTLTSAQRLLRLGVSVSMLMLACIANAVPTESSTESPLESAEVAIECISRPRLKNPCENDGPFSLSPRFRSDGTNPCSCTHNLLASPTKGHRLPNGLSAPLRC